MKRIYAVLLTLAMVFSMVPVIEASAKVYSGTCGENLTWSFDSETDTLTIMGTGDMDDYGSPSEVPWPPFGETIKSVVLPEGLTSIGEWAFYMCEDITSITIPDSVTRIGAIAFYECKGLTSIIIPENVTTIGGSAFAYCSGLTTIDIPDSVIYLGNSAFSRCRSLTTVKIGGNVDAIRDHTFNYCTSLTTVIIPDSVTTIGEEAFYKDTSLASVIIGSEVISIGERAFDGCTALKTVDNYSALPIQKGNSNYGCVGYYADSVNWLHTGLVSGTCGENLEYSLNWKSGVLTITGTGAMSSAPWGAYCSYIQTVILPENLTTIIESAFGRCFNLKTVENYSNLPIIKGSTDYGYVGYYAETINWYSVPSGICGDDLTYTFNPSTGVLAVTGNGAMGDYDLREIPWYPYLSLIQSVELPQGITTICDFAFYECSALTDVIIPHSVISIGTCAFYSCASLTSVTLGKSVTSIGNSAFYYCENLKTIHNYSGLYIIKGSENHGAVGRYADTINCRSVYSGSCGESLTYLYDTSTRILTIIGAGAMSNYMYESSPWHVYEDLPREVILPDGITSIGTYAFYGCQALTSVTIPDSIMMIGEGAFAGCADLTEFFFKGDAPEIDAYAFSGVTATVHYPAGNATWTDTVKQNYGGTLTWECCQIQYTQTVAPGCTTPGEERSTCTVCGYVQTKSIDALGHVSAVYVPAKEGTWWEEHWDAHYDCAVCGKLVVDKTADAAEYVKPGVGEITENTQLTENMDLTGEGEVTVYKNAVLDLNGKTLVVDNLDALTYGGEIIDSVGGGKLVVNDRAIFAESNSMLPIKTQEGYVFEKPVMVQGHKEGAFVEGDSTYRYKFYLENLSRDTLMDDYLGSDISLVVTVTYTDSTGTHEKEFTLDGTVLEGYKANWDAKMVVLNLTGLEGITALSCKANVISGGVKIG